LKIHWVLVVIDQFTRRIIGFGVHPGDVDGVTLCRMFNTAIKYFLYTSDAYKTIWRPQGEATLSPSYTQSLK
jgi:transposase InsO family protein